MDADENQNRLTQRKTGLKNCFSFYDSLIITASLETECETLYTEDLQHSQKIHGLTIMNPFLMQPGSNRN